MFLQIHTLTSYHASLLNRDDAGLAKRIPFGNSNRLRISSQCLKHHWTTTFRNSIEQQQDGWEIFERGWRTRYFFERVLLQRLMSCLQTDFPDEIKCKEIAVVACWELACGCFTKVKKESDACKLIESEKLDEFLAIPDSMKIDTEKGEQIPRPGQAALYGKPEADYLVGVIQSIIKDNQGDIKQIRKYIRQLVLIDWRKRDKDGHTMLEALIKSNQDQSLFAGLEGALFGRFVTSDILARSDAAVHVAHAFTVHGLDTEVDYFTVVDDLNLDEETGAAHAGDMELGAGLFYGYVAVDIPLLVSNLTGCDAKDWKQQDSADTRTVLAGLIEAIATVSPGAKLGSTAPYAYSDFVLLEAGSKQPRGLSNAYLQALPTHGDIMQTSVHALGNYLNEVDGMYGKTAQHRYASTVKQWSEDTAPRKSLDEAIKAILDDIFGA